MVAKGIHQKSHDAHSPAGRVLILKEVRLKTQNKRFDGRFVHFVDLPLKMVMAGSTNAGKLFVLRQLWGKKISSSAVD